MIYSFSHCADRYEASRQRERCPARELIDKIAEKGVKLNSVADFGTGTGFWLQTMQRQGHARGKLFAIDVSQEMLVKAKNTVPNVVCIEGGVDELAGVDLVGVDCIFLCMVAHLLDFPQSLAKLTKIAASNRVRHIVVVEEVSFFYYAVTGNPHYLDLLPEAIQNVLVAYQSKRDREAKPALSNERSGPYPIPVMDLSTWKTLGLTLANYSFEAPPDLGWSWELSPSDIVEEIRNRAYSMCFVHSPGEAGRIADAIVNELGQQDSYMQKVKLSFWFHLHVFEVGRIQS